MAQSDNAPALVSETVMRLPGERMAYRKNGERRRIAVIGAGPAGLGALRRMVALPDTEIICFEQGSSLGGTWLYTDSVGSDQFGVPTHSSLYKNLKTNLPKEVMHFPDFPYTKPDYSYIDATEVLQYLHDFAKEYSLEQCIKYNHRVTRVTPLLDLWSLSAMDLQTKHESAYVFDAVLVCSGPNITPVYPKIELAKFSGHQMHSKNYKVPDLYKGKRVLVIGLGPSGLDITYQISTVAEKVVVSTNKKNKNSPNGLPALEMPENTILKPSVISIDDKDVKFEDESIETIDAIIHCTGYTYNFPFLNSDCGITVDQFVFPLYKHFICIERPNLALIGLPKFCPHLFMVDFQVQCFVKVLAGEIQLPNKEEMMADFQAELDEHVAQNKPKKTFHRLGRDLTEKYFKDLAKLGQLEDIPPVQISMFNEAFKLAITDFKNFRDNIFTVIDNENYEITKQIAVES